MTLSYEKNVHLLYSVNSTTLSAAVQGPAAGGWLAVGISQDGTMKSRGYGSDAVWGTAQLGGIMRDMWITKRQVPTKDDLDDGACGQ